MIEMFAVPDGWGYLEYVKSSTGALALECNYVWPQIIEKATNETMYDLLSVIPIDPPMLHRVDLEVTYQELMVQRASNDIARTTRRGYANVIIGDEVTIDSLTPDSMTRRLYKYHVDDNIPRGELVVMWNRTSEGLHAVDGPFAFSNARTLKLHPTWQNYIRRMQVFNAH